MISNMTQKHYSNCLEIMKDDGVDLSDPKQVVQYIQDKNIATTTKKGYLSAIINKSKNDGIPVPPSYSSLMATYMKEMNKKADSQMLTIRQEANFMPWKDLLAIQADYASKVRLDDFQDLRDFLIISLYTLNDPVRADYGDMKVYPWKAPKDATGNYLVWGTRVRKFVFNDYKTSSKMGKVEIPVSAPLQKVIIQWFGLNHNMEWLMGEEKSANWLTCKVRDIMKRLTGKEVGINIFRHARITDHLGGQKSIASKKPLAMNMLHSMAVQEKYLVASP